jgi:hypothetical protein
VGVVEWEVAQPHEQLFARVAKVVVRRHADDDRLRIDRVEKGRRGRSTTAVVGRVTIELLLRSASAARTGSAPISRCTTTPTR